MFDNFLIPGRLKSLQKRVAALEESLEEVSGDVGAMRSQLATLRAKSAVNAREVKRARPAEQELLEELLGGKVLAIQEKSEDA